MAHSVQDFAGYDEIRIFSIIPAIFMTSSPERFRSATEFPQSIASLDRPDADALYEEMRACLIFTNRSRSQQIRRKEQYKSTAMELQSDVARLQTLIQQLATEKEGIAQSQRETIRSLEQELGQMSGKLDRFSKAFDDVEALKGTMDIMADPGRFLRFWQALRDLIFWWRDVENPDTPYEPAVKTLPPEAIDQDRKDNPQMHDDRASINRSLLDR